MKNGFSTPLLILIFLILVAGAGYFVFVQRPAEPSKETRVREAIEKVLMESAPAGSKLLSVSIAENKATLNFTREILTNGQGIFEDIFSRVSNAIHPIIQGQERDPKYPEFLLTILIEGKPLQTFLHNGGDIETANWKTYGIEEFGYEIKYPPDWKIIEYEGLRRDAGFNISIGIEPVSNVPLSSVNTDAAIAGHSYISINVQSNNDGFTLERFAGKGNHFEIDGVQAIKSIPRPISYETDHPAGFYKNSLFVRVYSIRGNVIYTIHGQVAGPTYEALIKRVENIISTFKFTGEPLTQNPKLFAPQEVLAQSKLLDGQLIAVKGIVVRGQIEGRPAFVTDRGSIYIKTVSATAQDKVTSLALSNALAIGSPTNIRGIFKSQTSSLVVLRFCDDCISIGP